MGRDRAWRSPKKIGKFQNSPKWPPAVPLCGQQWTSRCRLPRIQEMERQHNTSILWEFQSSITSPPHNRQMGAPDRYQLKIVQVHAPTTSHSDEETDNFYNTIDKILEKQTHYTIICENRRTNTYIRKGDRSG